MLASHCCFKKKVAANLKYNLPSSQLNTITIDTVIPLTFHYRFPLWKLQSLSSIFYNALTLKSNTLKLLSMYQNIPQLLMINTDEHFLTFGDSKSNEMSSKHTVHIIRHV